MSLTERQIAALPRPVSGQKLHSDGSIPGFGVRVSRGGTKTFVLVVGEKRRRITIGRYPIVSLSQARDKARNILAKRQLGYHDDLTPTFGEARQQFLASRAGKIRPSTARRDQAMLLRFSELDKRRIADIRPESVQAIINSIQAPTARSEALERFANLIRYLERRGEINHWPVQRLEGRRTPVYRDRVLDDLELAKVLATARIWGIRGHPYGIIVELLILTGQRRQQMGSLHRRHVDFQAGIISWPPDLMKNKRRHVIPVCPWVRAILERHDTGELFFPNKHGDVFTFSSAFDRPFKAECGVHDWVLHDLRRVFATGMQKLGVRLEVTEKLLSHRSVTGGLIGIYQRHSYLDEMREALQLWERRLEALLTNMESTNGRDVSRLHPTGTR